MNNYYTNKIEFHTKQQQAAHDSGKDKAAAFHKREKETYTKLQGMMSRQFDVE